MKISDIIKRSTIIPNLNIKSNLIFPLDIFFYYNSHNKY